MDLFKYIYSMKAKFFKFFKGNKEDLYCNGVYKISFGDNKCYVGSTTITFKKRLSIHYLDLVNNNHCNTTLTRCFNKYKDNIIFEIIEIINKEELHNILIREQYWIDFYNSYHEGYNEVQFAGHTTGFKMPEEIVEKRRKKYLQYNLNGDFIKEWNSLTDIVKEFGGFASKDVLKDSFHSAYGYLWRYKLDNNYFLKIDSYKDKTAYKILMYDSEGNFVKEYNSLLEAAKHLNVDTGNISRALKKDNNMAFGYIWKKWEENYSLKVKKYEKFHPFQKKIKVTFIENNTFQIFNTKRDLCKKLNISRSILKYALENNKGLMTRKKIKVEEIN